MSNMFDASMRTKLAQRLVYPRLVYPLFDRCLIKHVLTVWPLTSTSACLVTKTMFDDVWSPNSSRLDRPLQSNQVKRTP